MTIIKFPRSLTIILAFLVPILLTYLVFTPFLLLYGIMTVGWLGGWPEWPLVFLIPSGVVLLCLIPQKILNKRGVKFLNPGVNFFLSFLLNISPLIITIFISFILSSFF